MATQILGDGDFHYELVEDWGRLPADWTLPDTCAITIDEEDNVYVGGRGKQPVLVFDRHGDFLRSWGNGVIDSAHGLRFASDGFLYCADERKHVVRKFTPDGDIVLEIGTPGISAVFMGGAPFNGCNDVAVARNGDIFVSDGYGNARIHKYSANGRLLMSWGTAGTGPGEFNLVHNIWIDEAERLIVTDRENHRVQVFDLEGNFLEEWHHLHRPNGMTATTGQDPLFYITEIGPVLPFNRAYPNLGPRVSVLDRTGKILARLGNGQPGFGSDQFFAPHGIALDSEGALYVGEVSRSTWPDYFKEPPPHDLISFRKFRRVPV